jgi:hypothetical protein
MLQQTCYVKLSLISKPEDHLHDEQCKTNYKYVEKIWELRGPGSGTAGEASCWLYLNLRLTFQLLYMVFSLLVKFRNDTFRRVGSTSEDVHFRSKPKCLLFYNFKSPSQSYSIRSTRYFLLQHVEIFPSHCEDIVCEPFGRGLISLRDVGVGSQKTFWPEIRTHTARYPNFPE